MQQIKSVSFTLCNLDLDINKIGVDVVVLLVPFIYQMNESLKYTILC